MCGQVRVEVYHFVWRNVLPKRPLLMTSGSSHHNVRRPLVGVTSSMAVGSLLVRISPAG